MKQRFDNDEFLEFADSYLREAFPNPARTGCPADEELQKLAEDPRQADLSLTQHISFCSPCYVRYAALLKQEKERMRAGFFTQASNYWKAKPARVVWAASAVIVLLCIGIVLVISRGSSKPTYSAFAIDLTSASPVRGTSEQPAKREITVPQETLDLSVQLPIGSEEGAYEVSLRSGPNVLWSQVAQAKLSEHVVRLTTRVDFRPFSPGRYELTVESASGLRFVQPIVLTKSKQTASRSGWKGHALASVASRLISIRLPRWSHQTVASSGGASGDAAQLIGEADRLAWLGNWPAAAPLYGKAELLATQSGDAKATIHARVGRIRSQAEALPFAQVSEMLAAELENPIVKQDPNLRLFCLTAKGYTDLDVNLASCREAWEQALLTARELHDPLWESRASGELGIISFLEGDSAKAEKLVGAALLSAMKNGDVAAQVRFLSMIGNGLADLQRYDEASQFFTRALKLASETKDIGFPFMAYEGQARCLTALDKPVEASKLLQTALEQARRDEKRGHEAQILILLGELRLATNNVPEAEKYLRDAGELSRTSQFRRMESEAMYQLATIYRNEGKLKETEECLRRGIDASRAVGDTYYLPRDLSGLAEVKDLSGDLKQADALWEQATDVLEGMLVNAPSAYARSTMVAAASDIYLRHFELAATENDVTKAFRIVERARGRSVADLLWRRPSEKGSTHIDTSTERQITSLQVQLIRANSPKQRQELLSDLFEAEQKRSFALTSASRPYSVQRPAPLRNVQRALLGNEALLEYVLSDPDSYCLVLTRTAARLVSLGASRGRIELLVRDYLTKIRSRKNGDDAARRLYSILLARVPEARTKPRVVVIPDGVLHLLPFDALQSPNGKYVLESSVVTYAPSGTVLRLLRLESRRRPTLSFIGVGDVIYDESPLSTASAGGTARKESTTRGVYDLAGVHFEPLPGSRGEVLGASEIFGSGSVVLLGREATEAAFKHEPLAKFRVLHLAVHGIASTKYPERAALVLGRDSKSEDDGLLQTREIANLALNADLVTLSACDTGVGRLQGEEGNASLQRAFLLAGAKATLSTLWTADDTFTAALIKQFYKNLADGMDKGSALRTAKLELMKKFGDQAMPFYWAGFVLDGESSSPLLPRQ